MTKQRAGALIAFLVGMGFVGGELAFGIQTGQAGLFITGMGGRASDWRRDATDGKAGSVTAGPAAP